MKIQTLYKVPAHWLQHAWARNAAGEDRYYGDDQVCWCLAAAVEKCYPDPADRRVVRAKLLNVIRIQYGGQYTNLAGWNDCEHRTLREVRQVCRKANV